MNDEIIFRINVDNILKNYSKEDEINIRKDIEFVKNISGKNILSMEMIGKIILDYTKCSK